MIRLLLILTIILIIAHTAAQDSVNSPHTRMVQNPHNGKWYEVTYYPVRAHSDTKEVGR